MGKKYKANLFLSSPFDTKNQRPLGLYEPNADETHFEDWEDMFYLWCIILKCLLSFISIFYSQNTYSEPWIKVELLKIFYMLRILVKKALKFSKTHWMKVKFYSVESLL